MKFRYFPIVWAIFFFFVLAGRGAPNGLRTVRVRVAADREFRSTRGWESAIRHGFRAVSNLYERKFGIRWEIAEMVNWSSSQLNGDYHDLDSLEESVGRGQSEVLVGFSGKALQADEVGGIAHEFGSVAIVMEYPYRDQGFPAEEVYYERVLAHELGHLFGAFHVKSPQSIMSPVDTFQNREVWFDSQTVRVIQMMRDLRFARGVLGVTRDQARRFNAIFAEGHADGEINPLLASGYDLENPQDDGSPDMDGDVSFRDANLASRHIRQGVALQAQGRNREAISAFRKAIALNPRSSLAYADLGAVLGNIGRTHEAIRSLRQAIRLDPGSGVAHYFLAVNLYNAGNRPGARRETQEARKRGYAVPGHFLSLVRG